MTVVDASVAVKWFLPEAGASDALDLLLSGESLVAPTLIQSEVAAAVARKARSGEIDAPSATAAVNDWLLALRDGVVSLEPDRNDLPAAFRLSLRLRHPLQDCLYLALAERAGAPLVTADRTFAARAAHPLLRVI